MKESKRKEIEARLQELFAENSQEKPSRERVIQTARRPVVVIRRRKSQPDRQVA
jgi:hypothetical protein